VSQLKKEKPQSNGLPLPRGRRPAFVIGSKSRAALGTTVPWPPTPVWPNPEKLPRVTKSEAARLLKISRRTVIRYAQARLISEDRRGRVRLHEIADVLLFVPLKPRHDRSGKVHRHFLDTNFTRRVFFSNLCSRPRHLELLKKYTLLRF
jgi:hypothetical protein